VSVMLFFITTLPEEGHDKYHHNPPDQLQPVTSAAR